MLRILAGTYRSRVLATPTGEDRTRPMTSRARESVFDLLRGWFDGTNVLDLYAGVGTMGLEAVSRGAARVVMVERDRLVYRHLQANVAALGCEDRCTTILGDALGATALAAAPAPCSIAFLDPPYEAMRSTPTRDRVFRQAGKLLSVMAPKSFMVLRTPERPDAHYSLPGFDGPEVHRYGEDMHVLLYAPSAPAPAPSAGTPA